VRVWTDKTGPDYSWLLPRRRQFDAVPPPGHQHSTPEIRIVESGHGREAPMFAFIALGADYYPTPSFDDLLVMATYKRGEGWTVTHRPDGGGASVTIACTGKARARTELRAAARQHAKVLGVKVVDPTKGKPRP
jgi:hypothetical protein